MNRSMRRSAPIVAAALMLASPLQADPAPDRGRIAYLAQDEGYWQVFAMEPGGERRVRVTQSPYDKARASWFPDGEHLLVVGIGGELVKVVVATGEEEPLRLPIQGAMDAVLSPDGRSIAYSLSTAGSIDDNEIWVVGVDGQGLQRLTSMPYLQHEPAWSADARWLYFLSGDGGQAHDVWRVAADGAQAEQITVAALYHFELAPGPDGRLAYSNNRTGNYELYVRASDGSIQPLAPDPALDGHPTWSPDGALLAFHSMRSGSLQIWRVPAAGGRPDQLTRHEGGARAPTWWHPARSPS
jgi:TolB protein